MIESRKNIGILNKSVYLIILLLFFSKKSFSISTYLFEQDSVATALIDSVIPNKATVSEEILSLDSLKETINTAQALQNMIEPVTNKKANKKQKEKKIDTTHYSPKKAAIWGASFPGLGQVYNKKYWKLPIVYGILGTTIYFMVSNGQKLRTYNGYIRNIYNDITNPSPYDRLSLSETESFRDTYRRNLHIACFGTIFAWGLSIVDAVVDAHLRGFDISDKLSLKIKPELNYSNLTYYTGIGVHLNFK